MSSNGEFAGRALTLGRWGACTLAGALLLSSCVEAVEPDAEETQSIAPLPLAEFDPSGGVVPFPNDLLIDPSTGHLALPPACGEEPGSGAAALRAALNQLDGFATLGAVLRIPLSVAVDVESVRPRLLLVRLAERGQPLRSPEPPVELGLSVVPRTVLDESCNPVRDAFELLAIPAQPLAEASTYGAFMLSGVESDRGTELSPSVTWSLVRQSTSPVRVELGADGAPRVVAHQTPFDPREDSQALLGLSQLWNGHAPLLQAFDALAPALSPSAPPGRDELLLAFGFTTQSVTDGLDRNVAGSAAAQLPDSARLDVPAPVAGGGSSVSVEAFLQQALPGVGCDALGCAGIGALYALTPAGPGPSLVSPSFQTGEDCDPSTPAFGGVWSHPVRPQLVCEQRIGALVAVPSAPSGPQGYPTVIFSHGLGRSKEDLLVFAGALGAAGYASVAIDAVHHGSRAVQTSSEPALGCALGEGQPCADRVSPSCAPQCFAPLLTGDVPVTRDNLRQTAVDHLALLRALDGCGQPGGCGELHVDRDRIAFVGQSLGALIGATWLPSSGLRVGVLNVGGGDWMGILTGTDTLRIRCPLVDGLIAAGVLEGQPFGASQSAEALCRGSEWKSQPGYVRFEQIARWLLSPADGVGYARRYREGEYAVLLGEVDGDAIVPNSATESLGLAWGLSPAPARVATGPAPSPSAEALAPGGQWLLYADQPADAASGFPGNAFDHGSLLAPAPPGESTLEGAGLLGTAQMRTDAIAFLGAHL